MKCTLIVPARYASTRLPNKLVLKDTGKPLICHTVDAAVAACKLEPDLFSGVTVATDNDDIMFMVNGYAHNNHLPVNAVMTREDHKSGSDRIAEAALKLDEEPGVIINLQGDEPEIDPHVVVGLAKFMLHKPHVEMATLVYPLSGEEILNPNLVKVVCAIDGKALYFSRSAIPYDRHVNGAPAQALGHVGIYAYRFETLMKFVKMKQGVLERLESLEQLRALENGIDIYVRQLECCPHKGIDTREDYEAFVARFRDAENGK